MGKRYFGTDGIRGHVGETPITPDFVLKLGWAAGQALVVDGCTKVLIGKDTRISGYIFESALEAGFAAAGLNVVLTGPMPTPAIAYLTRTLRACAGIVVSASHNPYYDNGIKFFSHHGSKLPDQLELNIEAYLDQPMVMVNSAELGKAERINDAAGRYIEFCKGTVPFSCNLSGLKLVVDCANGATYHIAPDVFAELGAEVITIAAQPDGLNINQDCGATQPAALQQAVLEHQADLGIALDGDGDRVVMVDEYGKIVDGDGLLYIIAAQRVRDNLPVKAVVGTVMSNLGLELALHELGLKLFRSKVGDRYVLEQLQQSNLLLGGESSGHIICLDKTTTGDGIVSALQVLAAMVSNKKTLSKMVSDMSVYPQVMINVPVGQRIDLDNCAPVQQAVHDVEHQLGKQGRVLLRPSGTEPVIRVMVEGVDAAIVQSLASDLAGVVGQQVSA